ncbi:MULTISPECIES: type I-F CRISPR-associated protein Csy2 [unclassified Pseudoalteromonas]|uniref:type I-F CRISPR-associated protein Csy2 n=1 Tax=unclassified Pseudoalteromonas TaxID=194690 RepID=UPI0025B427D3|nr:MULTISPECIES: type I-F CRISPR-associated protein Csy2 [unclassified Pseudoalteromonas]MDN3380735.1 type I-F CRISPR-associated protein Csy2 [Pseudoalteromonas sp. APC 3893]MDN3389121.1 type I-F CRISPR-associated protein Csy2 [Pseudoalteromonas sp. APC 4017]
MNLQNALVIESLKEKTTTLRKLFAPYTAHVAVDGFEEQALTVLINLVYKRSEIDDLTSTRTAKSVLRDEVLLSRCINEVKWFHTHNLKYPDIRVSHQRLISEVVSEDITGICSRSLSLSFGWSHNSAEINHAKLFLTSFSWQGEVTCLAKLLITEEPVWINLIRAYGFTKKTVLDIAGKIKQQLPVAELPLEVSPFSPQLQMPFQQSYLAVTPVVSHAMLAKIQQLTTERKLNFALVEHSRPANVGDLASSVGGNIRVLRYFPKTYSKAINRSKVANYDIEKAFKIRALLSSQFQQALLVLVGIKQFNTLRQKRLARVAAIRQVRVSLQLWLDNILEAKNNAQEQAYPEWAKHYLDQSITNCISQFSNVLNESLSNLSKLKRFAYHPNLMGLFKTQLNYVFTHCAAEEETLNDEQIVYVHCQDMRVFDAETMANPYIQGMPSLTALNGLAHNFERKLKNFIDPSIKSIGSAIYIENYQLHTGKPLPEPSKLKQVAGRSHVISSGIIDKPKCDITLDLVFRLFVPNKEVLNKLNSQLIKPALPSMFAGGTMHPPSLYQNIDWCHVYSKPSELFKNLKAKSLNGSWLYPSKKVVKSFEQLIDALNGNFNLRPAAIGFAALEEPVKRDAALHEYHCYAEPVIGLLECVSNTSVKYAGAKQFFHDAFWVMDVQKESMLMKKSKFEYE